MPTECAPVAPLLSILHEQGEFLAVNKPAGLVCHPTKGSEYSSLIGRARLYLNQPGQPPIQPRLVNRLDRETSGVVLLAKTVAATAELGRIWEDRGVTKEYLAIVHGHLQPETGVINAPLGRDVSSAVAIKDCVRADGVPARTEFRVERPFWRNDRPFSLVRLWPQTGRKHQLRIHLSHLGHPVVGDKIYGGDERLYLQFVTGQLQPEQAQALLLPYQALHAAALRFSWRGQAWAFQAEPEDWFQQFVPKEQGRPEGRP
jgi:23S rRNA pseudouridine1911/1915/1917 synthase